MAILVYLGSSAASLDTKSIFLETVSYPSWSSNPLNLMTPSDFFFLISRAKSTYEHLFVIRVLICLRTLTKKSSILPNLFSFSNKLKTTLCLFSWLSYMRYFCYSLKSAILLLMKSLRKTLTSSILRTYLALFFRSRPWQNETNSD